MRKMEACSSKEEKHSHCYDVFSARCIFSIHGFLSMACIYSMRSILSVAIVEMVQNTDEQLVSEPMGVATTSAPVEYKHSNISYNNNTSFTNASGKPLYKWDTRTQSYILGSFFYGYTLSQVPASLVVQRFGGKRTFLVTLVLSSVFAIVTPFISEFGAWPLIAMKTLDGVLQGSIIPAINILVSYWATDNTRSRILAFFYCGIPLGTCCGMLFGGFLAGTFGWPSMFYVFGTIGVILSAFGVCCMYESPALHPRISKTEMQEIMSQSNKCIEKVPPVPWSSMLLCIPTCSLLIGSFGLGWMLYFFITELPTYVYSVLHFNIEKNGLLSAISHFVQGASGFFSCLIADKMRQRNIIPITTIRKIMNSIASFGSGICSLLMIFAGYEPTVLIIIIYFGMFIIGFFTPGIDAVSLDMSPHYAGVLSAFANIFVNLGGIFVTLTMGELTWPQPTLQNWTMVFVVNAVISFVCGTAFIAFGSAEIQKWDPASELYSQKSQWSKKSSIPTIFSPEIETTSCVQQPKY